MVKTTVTIEDDTYKRLAKEAVEKYGRTRNLSRLINEKLKQAELGESMVAEKEEEKKRIVKSAFGSWKTTETGAQYVRRSRKESEKRFRRLGI